MINKKNSKYTYSSVYSSIILRLYVAYLLRVHPTSTCYLMTFLHRTKGPFGWWLQPVTWKASPNHVNMCQMSPFVEVRFVNECPGQVSYSQHTCRNVQQ